MGNKRKITLAVLVTFIITSVITTYVNKVYYSGKLPFLTSDSDIKTKAIMSILDQEYINKYNKSNFLDAGYKSMVDTLGDPYTTYMSAKEWKDFLVIMQSSYSGIGVSVKLSDDTKAIEVLQVFKDSPAQAAGIKVGDKIIKIDGKSFENQKIDDLIKNIKGEKGTKAHITILQASTNKEITLDIERKNVKIDPVYSKMLENNIGYLEFSVFDTNCDKYFIEHTNQLIKDGAKSIIIDLRDNGGGLTKEATNIADYLLPKGKVIFTAKDKQGNTEINKSTYEGITLPIVLLVNENSASSSEILAASIKDNKRGILIGEKTFGKGLVQNVINFKDGSALKVTIQKYFTPNGSDINKQGIKPDYEVELKSDNDEQLMYAIEYLKKHQ